MSRKLFLSLFVFVVFMLPTTVFAEILQTVDFEAAGGYSTSIVEFNTGPNDYYTRLDYTNNSGNISTYAPYTNFQGDHIFCMEDVGLAGAEGTMTLSTIDISGKTSLQLKAIIAAQYNDMNEYEDNKHLSFYANIDGAGAILIGSFRGKSVATPYLYKDENINGVIDVGETITLSSSFSEHTFDISGTGSSLVITIVGKSTSSTEEIAYDNIRVLGTAACTEPTVPTVSASPTSVLSGSSSTLGISGTLNDATAWHIYTGSCGGTSIGNTATSSFSVSPTSTTTYYIRGEGGCATPASCASATVTVVHSPTLTNVSTLTGATEDEPFTISYTTLAAAANEADADGDTISFRVESVSSGTLTKGGSAVSYGSTLLSSGESWVWTPAADANGTLSAFTIKAWDGTYASSSAVQVNVSVAAVNPPTVTTTAASSISTTSATLGGEVTSDGGAAVSERGVVYSTSDATPTIAEGATQDANESGTGTFSESIGSLSVNTTYYYNSYAINSEGTSYGTAGEFTTLKQSQTITFGSLPTKTYGDADFAPGATASSGLTVSYSSSNTDVATIVSGQIHIVGAGSCTIYADQAGNSNYYAASQESQSLTINKATPSITWADPNDIVYGTALSATELNATSPVPGTFVYTPALTTVLDAGAGQTLSVEFTPTDAANYNNNTTATTINVTKATPSITWADPNDIVYGTALSATELNATSPVPGTFVYTPALTTVLDAGAGQTLSVEFTPTDAANYNNNTTATTINVTKATPSITWADPSDIVYGTALSVAELNATSPVAGTFVYTPALTTVLDAGAGQTLSVEFTPTDAANYNGNSETATINVTKATPTVTEWPIAAITYGQALSAATLSGGTASVAGSFAYDDDSITPDAGTYSAALTFTPTDGSNYNTVAGNIDVAVAKADPIITNSPDASEITYGETLADSILAGGTASVDGDFAFTTPTTAPNAGPADHDVTFTPTDGDNYNSVADSVSVTVERATLTAMAENKERDFGVDNPTFTVVYTDFVNSETEAVIDVVPTAATTADTSSPANSYDITVSGGEDDNYTFDYVKGTLTINAVAPAITTVTATEITTQTATAGGSIVSDGGTAITEKGVCYGETADPTTSGNCVADESVETTFSVSLTGLTPATTYFYRAFATSSVETVYGENLSFTTEGVISITSAQSFDVDENSSATTSVGTVAVTGDVQGTLTYSITDGNGEGGFGIDGESGLITVADQSVLDFETDDTFILTISVEDDENSDSETVEITLNNLNDSYPILTDAEYSLSELAENNAVVGTVAAVDADGDLNLITYDIISGNDTGVFTIDTDSGEITVLDNSTLDFETLEQYVLTVEASDTAQTTEAFVTVNITDENGVCAEAEVVGDLPYTNDSSTTERISSLTSYGTDCLADEYPSADFVYSVELVTGDRVEITLDPADDFDGILLLLANCGEDENCLLAANEVGVGENETLNYEAAQDETLFIVVEGADETTGDFTLNVTEWEEEVPDEIVVDEDPVTDDETPVDEDVVDPVDEDSFISVDEDEMMSTDDDALEVDEDIMTVDEDSEISIDDDPVVVDEDTEETVDETTPPVDDETVDSIDDDPADMDKENSDSDDDEIEDAPKLNDAACDCNA